MMCTWVGMTPLLLLGLSRLSLPRSADPVLNRCVKAYGYYFLGTRLIWYNFPGSKLARWTRPFLPRFLQQTILHKGLTSFANRWHRYPPHLEASKPLQVFNDPKAPRSSEHQIIYLNEPHGVGNAILSTLHVAVAHRLATNSVGRNRGCQNPVVLGSKSICMVPFLPELCWILCGREGFEFAESGESIVAAIRSGRDITLVPSGFSTIGTGGIVDWRKRKRFFQMLVEEVERGGEKRVIVLQPVLWMQELGLYEWFPKVRKTTSPFPNTTNLHSTPNPSHTHTSTPPPQLPPSLLHLLLPDSSLTLPLFLPHHTPSLPIPPPQSLPHIPNPSPANSLSRTARATARRRRRRTSATTSSVCA